MPELLEDADGAPLPPELQRDGIIWRTIRDRAVMDPPTRGDLLLVDGICIALAPVLAERQRVVDFRGRQNFVVLTGRPGELIEDVVRRGIKIAGLTGVGVKLIHNGGSVWVDSGNEPDTVVYRLRLASRG